MEKLWQSGRVLTQKCGKVEGFSHKNGGEDGTDERCTCKEDVTLRQMNRENLASSGTSAHSWFRSMKQKRVRYGGTVAKWKGFSHNNGGEDGVEERCICIPPQDPASSGASTLSFT